MSRAFLCVSVLFGYAVFAATYVPINRWSIGRRAATLYLPGEQGLPFLPQFEYLYVLTYAAPWLLVVAIRDRREYLRCLIAFAMTLAVAFTTYLVFPVYLERPRFTPHSLAERLLALEYLDPSYNHFPSLHVAVTWLVYLACRARLGERLLALVIPISLSTLFVKQHYFVDVLYGAVLAAGAWHQAGRFPRTRVEPAG